MKDRIRVLPQTSMDQIQSEQTQQGLVLGDQVALDLSNYLEKFPNKSFGIRILAKESGLNERTIKRLLGRKNSPTYQTLFSLYGVFLETLDEDKILDLAPESVQSFLREKNHKEYKVQKESKLNFEEVLKEEPLMAEFFVLAGTGPLDTSAIAFKFGQYGLELIKKMEGYGLLQEVDKGVYTLASQLPNLDGKILKFLGQRFTQRFAKPEKTTLEGENCISFYAESLNEEGMKEWLKVDTESFYKKIEIAKNPKYKGHTPAFTFTTTDTISWESTNV